MYIYLPFLIWSFVTLKVALKNVSKAQIRLYVLYNMSLEIKMSKSKFNCTLSVREEAQKNKNGKRESRKK